MQRDVEHFNLDAILSVGYRVNSKRGTQFRIWATRVLRQHLVNGYSINEKRLQAEVSRLRELQAAVDVIGRVLTQRVLSGVEAEGLLKVIADYAHALRILDQYDHQKLESRGTTQEARFILTVEAAHEAIARMTASMPARDRAFFEVPKEGWRAPSDPGFRWGRTHARDSTDRA